MDSDTFITDTIYEKFPDEYCSTDIDSNIFINNQIWENLKYEYSDSTFRIWEDFIKIKDFGIVCIDFMEDEYRVEDDKKWLINKIKYGF